MGEETPEAAGAASEEAIVNTRGEICINLDGQDYVLRPSRDAIAKIERQTRPLLSLAQAAESGALSLDEQAVCVVEMMHAYGAANPEDPLARDYKGANAQRIADLIFEAGSYKVVARLFVVLSGALYGGYTASGEVKPAETTSQ